MAVTASCGLQLLQSKGVSSSAVGVWFSLEKSLYKGGLWSTFPCAWAAIAQRFSKEPALPDAVSFSQTPPRLSVLLVSS